MTKTHRQVTLKELLIWILASPAIILITIAFGMGWLLEKIGDIKLFKIKINK